MSHPFSDPPPSVCMDQTWWVTDRGKTGDRQCPTPCPTTCLTTCSARKVGRQWIDKGQWTDRGKIGVRPLSSSQRVSQRGSKRVSQRGSQRGSTKTLFVVLLFPFSQEAVCSSFPSVLGLCTGSALQEHHDALIIRIELRTMYKRNTGPVKD